MQVEVDLARAQAAGVKPGDVRRAAATMLAGITVGNLFEQQKVFDVVVWGAPEIRQSEADIEQLLVDAPNGGHVRIGDVADVQVVPNPTVIRHESVSSYLDVTADVSGRGDGAVAGEFDALLKQVDFPLEHHAEVLGSYDERQDDRARVVGLAITAGIAVFLLLQAAFGSWRLAILSFITLPLAMAGAAVAVLLTGGTVTIGVIAGLVAVLGFAARTVVLLIRRYQDLERIDGKDFGPDIVIRGTWQSMAPTLISALAIAVVLAPIVVAGGMSGLEIVQPMAITVLGGLVTTVVLNLFVVPVLYLRFGFSPDRDDWADELFDPVSEQKSSRAEASAGVVQRVRPAIAVVLIIPGLSACGGAVVDTYAIEHEPAVVESSDGSDQVRITLEEEAARRLEIDTTQVEENSTGLAVPSSAIFVDPDGIWWVYTNPEPLVFVRHEIGLERDEEGVAYLSRGPEPGTEVVTVGVPELYGLEEAIAH